MTLCCVQKPTFRYTDIRGKKSYVNKMARGIETREVVSKNKFELIEVSSDTYHSIIKIAEEQLNPSHEWGRTLVRKERKKDP